MKSIKRFWLVGMGLLVSFNFLHAASLSSDSILSISEAPTAQLDSIVQLAAEAQGLAKVSFAELPKTGTFWLVMPNGITAPLPCPPQDSSLPVYQIADQQFLIDATGGEVAINNQRGSKGNTVAVALVTQGEAVVNLISQIREAEFNRAYALEFGLEDAGDEPPMFARMYSLANPDALWLEIANVANGLAFLNLNNGTNQVYAIWTSTNLLTAWQVERLLWPTNGDVTPFAVPTLNRQNLFVRAEDWTDKDSNGDGIPDWWLWKWFGELSATSTNLDSQGNTLDFDYANHLDPNVINFTVRLGNQNFHTTNATGNFLVLAGTPSFAAVLVNDTNLNNAVWLPYDGGISLNLGSTDGVHPVWFGLKGRAEDSQATWMGTEVTLNRQPPQVVITSSTANVTAAPYLQVQGYAPKPLARVTYDLSNAAGVVTNQLGFITDSFLDTNSLA